MWTEALFLQDIWHRYFKHMNQSRPLHPRGNRFMNRNIMDGTTQDWYFWECNVLLQENPTYAKKTFWTSRALRCQYLTKQRIILKPGMENVMKMCFFYLLPTLSLVKKFGRLHHHFAITYSHYGLVMMMNGNSHRKSSKLKKCHDIFYFPDISRHFLLLAQTSDLNRSDFH